MKTQRLPKYKRVMTTQFNNYNNTMILRHEGNNYTLTYLEIRDKDKQAILGNIFVRYIKHCVTCIYVKVVDFAI